MPFKKISIRNSLRRFSTRRKNDPEGANTQDSNGRRDSISTLDESYFTIYVHMLNDEICKFDLENNASGHDCLAKVAEVLELDEVSLVFYLLLNLHLSIYIIQVKRLICT